MDSEPVIIACTLCSMRPNVPDATKATCSKCQRPVWVAPSSTAFIATKPEAELICLSCMMKEIKSTGEENIEIATCPGAADEFKKAVEGEYPGDKLAERIEQFIRRRERP